MANSSPHSNGLATFNHRSSRAFVLLPLLAKFLFASVVGALPAPYNAKEVLPFGKLHDDPEDGGADSWVYLISAGVLVLLGGAFAGLTIALMGQDEIYLQVISTSGEGSERKHASKVLNLLKKGKHWVLVSLLLANVITNETLPIMLDRSLGGGWQAVLGSTVLIVIFGEIVPQSICVRFGLPIGSAMSPFVLALMWILAPVAWPTAKLLDYLLGEDHGTTYKKAGLKTLVTLHRTMGRSADERLNKDEVNIISGVLDLKEKPVGSIMTPMEDVFTLSADTVLDEDMINTILTEGYSRIPIYAVDDPENFIGMLLVKMLITYDPEDCLRVHDLQLATLPETRPETSCLDIINFFQEGKSHMILVSQSPGEPNGALGVCTLEDVIEELIGEEIIDESDVFVDVHKAIRRMHPVPYFNIPKSNKAIESSALEDGADLRKKVTTAQVDRKLSSVSDTGRPQTQRANTRAAGTVLMRRRSSGGREPLTVQRQTEEFRAHLKHLGPSNVASRPKSTRIDTVKIKPGQAKNGTTDVAVPINYASSTRSLDRKASQPLLNERSESENFVSSRGRELQMDAAESVGLLSAGKTASDGTHVLGYGTLSSSPSGKGVAATPAFGTLGDLDAIDAKNKSDTSLQQPSPLRQAEAAPPPVTEDESKDDKKAEDDDAAQSTPQKESNPVDEPSTRPASSHRLSPPPRLANPSQISLPAKLVINPDTDTKSTQSSDEDADTEEQKTEGKEDEQSSGTTVKSGTSKVSHHSVVRSGSIRARDVDVDGVRKVVLDVHAGHETDKEGEHGVAVEIKDKNASQRNGKARKQHDSGSSSGGKKNENNAFPAPASAEAAVQPDKSYADAIVEGKNDEEGSDADNDEMTESTALLSPRDGSSTGADGDKKTSEAGGAKKRKSKKKKKKAKKGGASSGGGVSLE